MKAKLFLHGNLLWASALVILVSALKVGNVAAQSSRHQMSHHDTSVEIELPFLDSKVLDAILVTVKVNGKDAVLIFDTGSNRTILSPQFADDDLRDRTQFHTLFPESTFVRAEARWGRITLQIASQTWKNRQVVVKNQDDLSRVFGQKIDGILGKDVLNEFGRVTIDFPSHLIRLSR